MSSTGQTNRMAMQEIAPERGDQTGDLALAPIQREGASERLAHRLLGMVTAGTLRPGDRLPGERELAELFNVSRPTVREAIKALIVLGVLRSRHGDGMTVSPLQAADLLGPLTFFLTLREVEVERLYEARGLIEGEIAALACAAAGPAAVAELEALIVRQEALIAVPEGYRALDTAFHGRLAELAGNPFLARAAESMNILGLEARKTASETPAVIRRSIADHRAIVAALAQRDPGAARAAMRTHMANVLATSRRAPEAGR
ncbi:MAG: FadR family transcriptional regulator [Rhodobacteraceae bacterium]|nr:FadR family transcriptional regulator [Paracoccaceae bacterium]